ncbi:MAG: hypothetical protein HY938_02315 [Nitrosomonadales bacterium]|nr:hypothetical protein [Nitrosomonadales bacterium]
MPIPEPTSARFCKYPSGLLLGVALFFPMQSTATDQPDQPIHQPEYIDSIDAPRDYLSGKFVEFAGDIDRFFGDDRNYQESNKSVLQMDITRLVGRGAERKFVLSGRAKLHLPAAEKRLHLMLETNPDKNVTGEPAQTQSTPINQVAAPESYAAAARYENAVEQRWHFSADAGLKFQGLATSPFARARGSFAVPLDTWRLKAAETLFWFNTTGQGTSTDLDLERPVNESMMFRASSNATGLRDSRNFDLRQDISVYHTLDERRALLHQASVIGVSQPQLQVTEYVLLLLYRYHLHRDWMFLELSPQLHYPRAANFRVTPLLGLRLELLFDDSD